MKNQALDYCRNKLESLGSFKTFVPYLGPEQLDQAIECFEKEGIVQLYDIMTSNELAKFIDKTTRSGILILLDLPSSLKVPTRISVIRCATLLLKVAPVAADYTKNHIEYKRKVENFSKRAFCMVGNEYDRANIIQCLYAFGFDNDIEMFHPKYSKTHADNNMFGINQDLASVDSNRLEPIYRYDYGKNLPVTEKVIKDKDIEIVLPNRCLQDPITLSEKNLTNFVFGVPGLHVLGDSLKTLMKDYDFDVISPQGPDLLRSTMEWLALFCRLTTDQRQRFQNDNAETIIQNQQSLLKLSSRLLENFKEDFRKL